MPYSQVARDLEAALNVVPNDWKLVTRRLRTRLRSVGRTA